MLNTIRAELAAAGTREFDRYASGAIVGVYVESSGTPAWTITTTAPWSGVITAGTTPLSGFCVPRWPVVDGMGIAIANQVAPVPVDGPLVFTADAGGTALIMVDGL